MVRLRGRSPIGERLVDYAPHGHWKIITFVGGLRLRGMTAPFVLEGAMNGPLSPRLSAGHDHDAGIKP